MASCLAPWLFVLATHREVEHWKEGNLGRCEKKNENEERRNLGRGPGRPGDDDVLIVRSDKILEMSVPVDVFSVTHSTQLHTARNLPGDSIRARKFPR